MIGFLNVYKPPGMSSFAVVKKASKVLPKMKIGHLGTLDPMATGVLPLALGQATRLIEWVDDNSKTYRASMVLGAVSDTQDQWGTLQPTGKNDCSLEEFLTALAGFQGEITQIPPMYSAVHHQGKRLYELARKGIEVERKARPAFINKLTPLDFSLDSEGKRTISFEVDCGRGTYIRTLCHDIGEKLGTGAYLSALERTRWGAFCLEQSLTLENLAHWQNHVLPATRILPLPQVILTEEGQGDILLGRPVSVPACAVNPGQYVLLLTPAQECVAVAYLNQQGALQPKKVLQ